MDTEEGGQPSHDRSDSTSSLHPRVVGQGWNGAPGNPLTITCRECAHEIDFDNTLGASWIRLKDDSAGASYLHSSCWAVCPEAFMAELHESEYQDHYRQGSGDGRSQFSDFSDVDVLQMRNGQV